MLFPSSHLVSASCAVFSAPPPQPPILLLLPELSRGEAAWGEASVAALRSPPAPHNSAAAGAPLLLLRALVSAARTALYNYTWPIHTTPQQYTGPTVSQLPALRRENVSHQLRHHPSQPPRTISDAMHIFDTLL